MTRHLKLFEKSVEEIQKYVPEGDTSLVYYRDKYNIPGYKGPKWQ
jgi:hypothetical protein